MANVMFFFILDRLTLPGEIVEDGRETANYDCDTGLCL